MTLVIQEKAAAKINLDLHITGKNATGYHLLDSLVVFCEFGDILRIHPAPKLSLTVTGPYKDAVPTGMDNLILKAVANLQTSFEIGKGARIELEKNIPAAAGVGGGSADAAAAMRAVMQLWGLGTYSSRLKQIGLKLGADIPVCLDSQTSIMRGVGEKLTSIPQISPFLSGMGILLVNPGQKLSTVDVFKNRAQQVGNSFSPAPKRILLEQLQDRDALIEYLQQQQNDLAHAAITLAPEIKNILEILPNLSGCLYSNMSGSGATCFALFANEASARAAANELKSKKNSYWAVGTRIL